MFISFSALLISNRWTRFRSSKMLITILPPKNSRKTPGVKLLKVSFWESTESFWKSNWSFSRNFSKILKTSQSFSRNLSESLKILLRASLKTSETPPQSLLKLIRVFWKFLRIPWETFRSLSEDLSKGFWKLEFKAFLIFIELEKSCPVAT